MKITPPASLPTQFSRRRFLTGCGQAVIGLGLTPWLTPAIADNTSTLGFRQNAKPLLLHFNENSLGMSTKALTAAQQALRSEAHRYPQQAVNTLRQALAQQHNVTEEQVLLGNGSTEVIGAVIEKAVMEQATLIEPVPTFGDASQRARMRGLSLVQVPVQPNFSLDLDALKKQADALSGAVLINICNPNNPTGSIADQSFLENWVRHAKKNQFFLIDEAYFEYAQAEEGYRSLLPLISEGYQNLVVTRTFSKIYAMAGMRIGYGFAAPSTAASLRKLLPDFNLGVAGIAAAIASLDDEAFFQRSLATNKSAKQLLTSTLDELGLSYIPSYTNFVLHRINGALTEYSQRMAQNNIRVGRRMTPEDGWNRISLGTPEEMVIFTETLRAFRQRGWV